MKSGDGFSARLGASASQHGFTGSRGLSQSPTGPQGPTRRSLGTGDGAADVRDVSRVLLR